MVFWGDIKKKIPDEIRQTEEIEKETEDEEEESEGDCQSCGEKDSEYNCKVCDADLCEDCVIYLDEDDISLCKNHAKKLLTEIKRQLAKKYPEKTSFAKAVNSSYTVAGSALVDP